MENRKPHDLARARTVRTKHSPSHDVPRNATREGPSASRARVLVVEDEAAYGRCLVRTIERCGGSATLVGTVREARERLASGGPWIGFTVDVGLLDGSGLDFLREARASGVDVPTLIISGFA